MRSLYGTLLVVLIACQGVYADSKDPNDPNDPNEVLQTKWDAAISVLKNKDLGETEKQQRIDKIVTTLFDFPLMVKLALGKTHWPTLTSKQRQKFTVLFNERLRDSYRANISLYTDEEVHFKPAVKKGKTVQIPVELISGDETITILHKLWRTGKHWKVYDVEIQKVSILLTYRSQFNDILKKGTVDDLLSRLEKSP
jgi:phospholipid transport system substrate-binding protein